MPRAGETSQGAGLFCIQLAPSLNGWLASQGFAQAIFNTSAADLDRAGCISGVLEDN